MGLSQSLSQSRAAANDTNAIVERFSAIDARHMGSGSSNDYSNAVVADTDRAIVADAGSGMGSFVGDDTDEYVSDEGSYKSPVNSRRTSRRTSEKQSDKVWSVVADVAKVVGSIAGCGCVCGAISVAGSCFKGTEPVKPVAAQNGEGMGTTNGQGTEGSR